MRASSRAVRAARWIAAAAAAAIVLFWLAPLAVVPAALCRRVDYGPVEVPDVPCRPLSLTTSDGELLSALLVPAAGAGPETAGDADAPPDLFGTERSLILLTGADGPPVSLFLPLAGLLADRGVTTLLLEVRAHGASSGDRLGMGYDEVEDVRAAWACLDEASGGADVYVMGFSMGGAAAVNAFGRIDGLDGLVAVSAYASFDGLILEKAEAMGVPGFLRALHRPLILASLRALYGVEAVRDLRPEVQIAAAGDRPVLLMAAADDPVVPVSDTEALAAACPAARVWIRPGGDHLVFQNNDPLSIPADVEFCAVLTDFLCAGVSGEN